MGLIDWLSDNVLTGAVEEAIKEVKAVSTSKEQGPVNRALRDVNKLGESIKSSRVTNDDNDTKLSSYHIPPRSIFISKSSINNVVNGNRLWYGHDSVPETGARVIKLLGKHVNDKVRIKIAIDFQRSSNQTEYLRGRVAFAELVYQAQMRIFDDDGYVTGVMTDNTYDYLNSNRDLFYRNREELFKKYQKRFKNRILSSIEESRDALENIQEKLYLLSFTPNKNHQIISRLNEVAGEIKEEIEDLVDKLESGETKEKVQSALGSFFVANPARFNIYVSLATAAGLLLSGLILESPAKISELTMYTNDLLGSVSKTDHIIESVGERQTRPPRIQDVVNDAKPGEHGFDPKKPLITIPEWEGVVKDLNELRLLKPVKGGGGPNQDPDPEWNKLIQRIRRALKILRNRADNNLGVLKKQVEFVRRYYRKLVNPKGSGMN